MTTNKSLYDINLVELFEMLIEAKSRSTDEFEKLAGEAISAYINSLPIEDQEKYWEQQVLLKEHLKDKDLFESMADLFGMMGVQMNYMDRAVTIVKDEMKKVNKGMGDLKDEFVKLNNLLQSQSKKDE